MTMTLLSVTDQVEETWKKVNPTWLSAFTLGVCVLPGELFYSISWTYKGGHSSITSSHKWNIPGASGLT